MKGKHILPIYAYYPFGECVSLGDRDKIARGSLNTVKLDLLPSGVPAQPANHLSRPHGGRETLLHRRRGRCRVHVQDSGEYGGRKVSSEAIALISPDRFFCLNPRSCMPLSCNPPALAFVAHTKTTVHQLEGRHSMNAEYKSNRAGASAEGRIPTRTPLPLPHSSSNITGAKQNAKVRHAPAFVCAGSWAVSHVVLGLVRWSRSGRD